MLLYCLFLTWLIIGWLRTEHAKPLMQEPELFYSIIIPFRNEAALLSALIKSLQVLDFPSDRYEILLIDDHSDDHYEAKLTSLPKNISFIKLIDGEGKKAALKKGIESATGDVIITTDADCLVPKGWLRFYAYCFEEKNARLAFGGVAFKKPETFFQQLQQVEFSSLIGSGAATLNWGFPSMSNGANFAFLKEAFKEVGGYADNLTIPSGDDEFLLHKVYNRYPENVFFIKNKDAVVQTSAAKDLSTFFNQRRRWSSKWKYYSNPKNSLLALLVLAFNLSILVTLVFLVVDFNQFKWFLIPLSIKVILEGIFLKSVLKKLNSSLYFWSFIFLQITYPIYVIIFGITANFGQYQWKGRTHKL